MEKKYDLTCKYELEWVVKAPWSKVVLREDELLHVIKCTICSAVGPKPCVMAPKWDTISRHTNRETWEDFHLALSIECAPARYDFCTQQHHFGVEYLLGCTFG